jgi:hypothetical protein
MAPDSGLCLNAPLAGRFSCLPVYSLSGYLLSIWLFLTLTVLFVTKPPACFTAIAAAFARLKQTNPVRRR